MVGFSKSLHGVHGTSDHGFGLAGISGNVGVYAYNDFGEGNDVYLGARGFAGDFHGGVSILGK